MTQLTLARRVDAPPARVFDVFTDFERAHERIASIERVEKVTAGPVGAGTRLRETRSAAGQRQSAEIEVTRFEPGEGYALACETHGCRITTAVLLAPDGGGTSVEVALEVEPLSLGARLKLALVWPMIRKEFEKDLDALKRAAEALA